MASITSPTLVVEYGGEREESVVIKSLKKTPNFPSSVLFMKVVQYLDCARAHVEKPRVRVEKPSLTVNVSETSPSLEKATNSPRDREVSMSSACFFLVAVIGP